MRIPERARLGVAALAAGVGVVAGCAGRAEPTMSIAAVTPSRAFSDDKVSLVIEGGPFRPVYDIDTSSGTEMTELGAFTAFLGAMSGEGNAVPADSLTWLSSSQLAAIFPAHIAPGTFDVEVRDPRGALALLPAGFTSLGDDLTPPTVTIDEPADGTIVTAGAEVPVAFQADDGAGTVTSMDWAASSSDVQMSGSCEVPPDAPTATCRFLFVWPKPSQVGQPLVIKATAHDSAGNVGVAQSTLEIGVPPLVATVAPLEGPTVGGTRIAVTGANFIPGTQVFVGGLPLQPNGGLLMSSTLIEGTTPEHDPGLATVTVRAGSATIDASDMFAFIARPRIRAITPTSGPLAGCTPVTIVGEGFREEPLTRIWFGADSASGADLLCPTFVGPNRIEGFAPPGTGAASVFADDPVGGMSQLPLAYTYLDPDDTTPDAAAPVAGCACRDGGAP